MTLYRASVPAVIVVRHHCHTFDTDMMICEYLCLSITGFHCLASTWRIIRVWQDGIHRSRLMTSLAPLPVGEFVGGLAIRAPASCEDLFGVAPVPPSQCCSNGKQSRSSSPLSAEQVFFGELLSMFADFF